MTPDVLEMARRLIQVPSPNPPGDERAVAGLVGELLAELGLPAATRVALDERRPNLLSTVDFGPGGRHLVLCGHLDTKPLGDARWSVDPLAADVDGDRLYGLGSADMKAAVAAMLVAAARLAASNVRAGRLSMLFTADEEDGARFGARHVAAEVPLHADGVLIGEPGGLHEDFDRLHLVSRGIARMRVTATARQGHSSLSGEPGSRNAGVDAARAVLALVQRAEAPVPDNRFGLSGWELTLNTGLVYRGGVGYGVLPGRISVDTEVRLLPGVDRAALSAALRAPLDTVARDTGADLSLDFDAAPNDWLPPTMVAPDHPLAAAVRDVCAERFGAAPPDAVFPGTTDATWFAELQGVATLPAFGPGLLRRAHGADEWVSVAAVRQAVDLYTDIAQRFCPAGDTDGR